MLSKKAKQKLMKKRICAIARVFACASFLILTIIGVSSLVRAMSLETIINENGVPASWEAASLGNPDTITVPATFWDQRQDDCKDQNRQFEWVICGYWTAGTVQGIIKDHLGADGLPIPAFTNSTDAWNANYDVFTANVTGNDPVRSTDNFYRWFHETPVSKKYNREITFKRTGTNTYTYGREGVFPLDDVDFSKNDSASKQGHNYHFTSHMRFAMKVAADGKERFDFSGDDDVWVFLNGKLILDIGGLHEKLSGWFTINQDGTISTYVQHVNDTSGRAKLGKPSNDFNSYVNPLNEYNRATFKDQYRTINAGISEGDVVNLDFFYAERSTTESNTKITISNMYWPISANSHIEAEIVGKIEDKNSHLVQFNTSITNRDPENKLQLDRLSAYVHEVAEDGEREGFLPLSASTLYYTTTPNDEASWQPVDISKPDSTTRGFNLAKPLTMSPSGTANDTLYFRYFAETSEYAGKMTSTVSYYTTLDGAAGITYDYDSVNYDGKHLPKDHNLTINYLYKEDNSVAAPPHTSTVKTGEDFEIVSPEITEHTPDYDKISGTMPDEDVVYTVYYSKTPTTPVDPEPEQPEEPTPTPPEEPTPEPEQPEEPTPEEPTPEEPNEVPQPPSLPILPSLPGSDIINGDLTYLGPLGEIAYVPNTGIVSDAVATIFEVGFAEVILSQAFVMATLLVFAGSFAIWFSLRQYMKFNPEAITTTGNRAAMRKKTTAKSLKKMPKSTNKKRSTTTKSAMKTKKASSMSSKAKTTKK